MSPDMFLNGNSILISPCIDFYHWPRFFYFIFVNWIVSVCTMWLCALHPMWTKWYLQRERLWSGPEIGLTGCLKFCFMV